MYKKLAQSAEFKDPSKLDADKVTKMGSFLTGMPPDKMESIPAEALKGALSTMKNLDMSRSQVSFGFPFQNNETASAAYYFHNVF